MFRRALITGWSKHGKTTSLYLYVKSQIEKTGKKVIVINVDGGSIGYWENTDIANSVRVIYPERYKHKLAIMRALSQGLIPKDREGKKLVKLDIDRYSDLVLDGLSETADMFMHHIASHEELMGVKHALAPAGVFNDGDEVVTVNSISHYNVVHRELKRILKLGFFQLPVNVFVTALISEGENQQAITVYGPATAGNAITAKVNSWFSDSFHQEAVRVKEGMRYRLWFEMHEDRQSKIPYLCGVRLIPSRQRELLKRFPKGYIPVDSNTGLQTFYEFAEVKGEKQDA